jgi:hypothetical protein
VADLSSLFLIKAFSTLEILPHRKCGARRRFRFQISDFGFQISGFGFLVY